jgi:non-ribosomal peptide synthetase-like protein
MGAKIGKHCLIDTQLCMIFDLVSIGDESAIGGQSHILGYRVEDGLLKLGTIDIGSRCFVGIHSCLGLNTKMEDDTYLDDQSLLPDGEVMRSGEARRGSPAQPAEVSLPTIGEQSSRRRHPFLFGLLHILAAELVLNLLMLAGLPYLLVMTAAYVYLDTGWAILSLLVTLPFSIVMFCCVVAGLKAIILRRPTPGTYSVESWYYLRKWTSRTLLEVGKFAMYTLYATIYLPPWLRMLGAKIGRGVEVATNCQIPPDMTVIGDDSFCADGCTIGGQRFFRGHVQLAISRIGSRTFVGNSALVPVGANMGDNGLLGVLSITPGSAGSTTPDGTEWLGSPPFHLPHRKAVEGIDVSKTFKPTKLLFSLRAAIDAMRILVPISLGINASVAYVSLITNAYEKLSLPLFVLAVPACATLVAFGLGMAVILIKMLVMGEYHPVVQPLWSRYVWLNEAFTGLYEATAAPILMPMLGTPFVSWYLRRLGCKIGEHCFLETTLFGEFDLVDIGDYASLNLGVVVQNHLFEDRVMKSSFLKIGDNCNVGNMSAILYDSEMCEASSVGALSLLMKSETLPPQSRWIGLPTRQVKA